MDIEDAMIVMQASLQKLFGDAPITDENREQIKARAEEYLNGLVAKIDINPIVTAGALRRIGIRVGLDIHDDYWVPLDALDWSISTKIINGSVLSIRTDCSTRTPFNRVPR